MNLAKWLCFGLLFAAVSCGPGRAPEQGSDSTRSPTQATPTAVRSAPSKPQAKPTTDSTSSEAAVKLVHGFVDLLNQHRFDEAYMLLGPGAPRRADFDRQFARYADLKVTVGAPGDQEGAAGSIYLSVPLTVSGTLDGKHVISAATALLRRVNDVPGSTEAQRHWHIERIDWGSGA